MSTIKGPLKALNKTKVNIVLVGQTGAGKTTFFSLLDNLFKGDGPTELKDTKDKTTESGLPKSQSQTSQAKIHKLTHGPTTFQILDTPGFADTRGEKQHQLHREMINEGIKKLEQVDAIILLANGTVERVDESTKLALSTVGTMFPRSVKDNMGIILTFGAAVFLKSSLPEDLQGAESWEINNPLGMFLEFKAKEDEYLQKEKDRKLRNIKSAYEEVVEVLNEWLQWLEDRPVMPTTEIEKLNELFNNIQEEIQKATDDVKQEAENLKELEAKKKEYEEAKQITKKAIEDATTKTTKKMESISTSSHNTYCDEPGCIYTCHEKCNLPKLKDSDTAALRLHCEAFDYGRSDSCLVCGHDYRKHKHFNLKREMKTVEPSEELKDKIAKAQSNEGIKAALIEDTRKNIEETKERMAKAPEIIRNLINKFNDESLGKSFAGHIRLTIDFLNERKKRLQNEAVSGDALEEVEKSIQMFENKLEEIKKFMETELGA